jgi:hypothetical protein
MAGNQLWPTRSYQWFLVDRGGWPGDLLCSATAFRAIPADMVLTVLSTTTTAGTRFSTLTPAGTMVTGRWI